MSVVNKIKTPKHFILILVSVVFLPSSFALQATEVPDEQSLNCYVFKTSLLALGSNLSDANLKTQSLPSKHNLSKQISANNDTETVGNKSLWLTSVVSFYRFITAIPAPIIFICLWLIVFKLLRIPKPELNRAANYTEKAST
jgi:uncharacterized membrane protein